MEKSFIEYGISTTSTTNNIQNRKSYFSIPTGLSHSLTNTKKKRKYLNIFFEQNMKLISPKVKKRRKLHQRFYLKKFQNFEVKEKKKCKDRHFDFDKSVNRNRNRN